MNKYNTLSKDPVEFASRLREGGRFATTLNRILCDQGFVRMLKQRSNKEDAFWDYGFDLDWYTCDRLATQVTIDFARLTACMQTQQIRRSRNLGDKCWAFLASIHPCVAKTVRRELYICIHCEGVYADEPVSQCDCLKGTGHDFVKSSCEYTLTEQ
jgi:hypothetical protein